MHPSGLILALAAAVLLVGCAGPSPYSLTSGEAAYATTYLAPDGSVIVDSRSGRQARGSRPGAQAQPAGTWEGDGVTGAPSIVIDLSDQQARFYKGGRLVGTSPVSTGREGYHTPSGSFRVIQKNADHYSNLYGDYVDGSGNVVVANVGVNRDPRPAGTRFRGAAMPYFMRVHGAVGMHGGYLPGYPASHGCIRLPMEMARIYFENAPMGTPVSIIH